MKKTQGVTLLTLLYTLLIISILHSIAAPSFNELINTTRTNSLLQHIFSLVQHARSTAVFLAEDVLLCPTKDQKQCSSNWQHPLMIFIDKDRNKQRSEDERIDVEVKPLKNNERLLWRGFGSQRYIQFTSDGSTQHQNGSLIICSLAIQHTQQIILYRSGRARKARKNEIQYERCTG